ncbi:MAG: DUF1501 domain-containing protein [Planctomycetota bacterium]|jgi:uncharacterized protein (DUF1501 family)|nr:DUF1501 domain-containing protein [Planctomycetota bacterium]
MNDRNDSSTARTNLDRRGFVAGGLSLLGGAGLLSSRAFAALGAQEEQADRTLVLIQLSGGNDGLSTVVPFGDDAYQSKRSRTLAPSEGLHKLDGYRALHPNLGKLARHFEEGGLAIVEGVGYPGPVRSHFKSLDVWHSASLSGRAAREGWVGKVCNTAWKESPLPELVVHLGGKVPYSLHSLEHSAVAFEIPESYRWLGDGHEAETLRKGSEGGERNSVLDRLRGVLRDAQESSTRIRAAARAYRTDVEYPDTPFGRGLRVIAGLIEARGGTRVFSIELGGFDTHNNQKAAHDTLMSTVDDALNAFLRDLRGREAGDRTMVMMFSEFGRRVAENGSGGTDHGKAGPMFLAGTPVEGGIFGEHPSMTELDGGDLAFTTDFRSVYATAIEDWFGVPHAEVLGETFKRIPYLKT